MRCKIELVSWDQISCLDVHAGNRLIFAKLNEVIMALNKQLYEENKVEETEVKLTPKTNPEFEVHMLTDEGIRRAELIKGQFEFCLNGLETVCPPGREMSIVKTKLEEACFFAKKAMAKVNSK